MAETATDNDRAPDDVARGDPFLRRKGDAAKVRIAQRLRRETTVSQRWIAQELSMGSVSNVTFCLTARSKQ